MAQKKAFIFDTNFIVQNLNLDEVVENLKKDYNVYVTQVSIDERIAQHCRELKQQYNELERLEKKTKAFSKITYLATYEEAAKAYGDWVQKSYATVFGERIIGLSKDEVSFTRLIQRANEKLPPFSSADNASDKGFKDYLLWASILDYFKKNGEQKIEFLSNDKAFTDNAAFLIKEFKEQTGKEIVFKPNDYYKDLIKEEQPLPKEEIPEIPINITELRNEIEYTIESLTLVTEPNYFGDERWYKTFVTTKLFEKDNIVSFFNNLDLSLHRHLFEGSIRASDILNFDNNIVDGEREIPTDDLEKARDLFKRIKARYPEFLEQFYTAATKVLNRNYNGGNNEEDLPF